jgi:hypothetical protein
MFRQDFKELLSAFNEHQVKYLIVGGYAVAIHAQPRATKDLDLFVQPDPDNAKAVFSALAKFGALLGDLSPEQLIDPNSFFRIGTAPQPHARPGHRQIEHAPKIVRYCFASARHYGAARS